MIADPSGEDFLGIGGFFGGVYDAARGLTQMSSSDYKKSLGEGAQNLASAATAVKDTARGLTQMTGAEVKADLQQGATIVAGKINPLATAAQQASADAALHELGGGYETFARATSFVGNQAVTGLLMAGATEVAGTALKAGARFAMGSEEAGCTIQTAMEGTGCFAAGTLVWTSHGPEPIERLRKGEFVWSYDLASAAWALEPVEQRTARVYRGDVVSLGVGDSDETIEATGNHPIWVTVGDGLDDRPLSDDARTTAEHDRAALLPGRWVEARAVRAGDVVETMAGASVVTMARVRVGGMWVFNLTVEGQHDYAVGPRGMLVHNTVCGGLGAAADGTEAVSGVAANSEAVGARGASNYDNLLKEAQAKYPRKAGLIENHHIAPKYLGGAAKGATAPLDGAYHQVITNAFREAWPYGQGAPGAGQLSKLMNDVYSKFPLLPTP